MDENSTSIINVGNDELISIAESAERRIEAVNRIKGLALKVTRPTDWADLGGKPYMQVSGAEKIARLFGISWRIDQPEFNITEDGHFEYTYKGYFSMGTVEIEAIGVRSSRDKFYSESHGEAKPPSEIDRGDLKKAAYTNLIGNGITRLLGLRNMTWGDLETAGIKRSELNKVEYGKPEMTEAAQTQIEDMRTILNTMSGGDPKKFADLLEFYTTFKGKDGKTVAGRRTLEGLTEKSVPITHEKLQKAFMKWTEQHAPVPESDQEGLNINA
ncbi:MAG: hypothetical protein WC477_06045 [Patescibacteria group bacterium]